MAADDQDEAQGIGQRVKRYRLDRGWNLSELAEKAEMSKGYLWAIENGEVPRPSGKKLYGLAKALGVTMSDLMGRELLTEKEHNPPPALLEFAKDHRLPAADVRMLSSIQFRGGQPQTKERWALIYSTIRDSEWIDNAVPAKGNAGQKPSRSGKRTTRATASSGGSRRRSRPRDKAD